MFTPIRKRHRGRPSGETPQGTAARQRLYAIAIDMIGERGFDTTTLRDIAARAGVSAGLLYRYFPSKQAIVLALYEELSAQLAEQAGRRKIRTDAAIVTAIVPAAGDAVRIPVVPRYHQ